MNQFKHVGHFGCNELTELRKYGVDWRPYCLKCDRWLDPQEMSEEEFADPNQVQQPPELSPVPEPVPSMKAGMTTLNRKEKKDVRPEEPEDAA